MKDTAAESKSKTAVLKSKAKQDIETAKAAGYAKGFSDANKQFAELNKLIEKTKAEFKRSLAKKSPKKAAGQTTGNKKTIAKAKSAKAKPVKTAAKRRGRPAKKAVEAANNKKADMPLKEAA